MKVVKSQLTVIAAMAKIDLHCPQKLACSLIFMSAFTLNWNKAGTKFHDWFALLQSQGRACCVCDSVDGRYIFIGLPRGLAAVDVQTQEKVANWEEESVDIHYVKAYLIGVQVYLVVTIDDMGN